MLKTRRTKTEWVELLTKQEESGQGVKEWCTANGVNLNTMHNQIAKRRKMKTDSECKRTAETRELTDTKIMPEASRTETVEWRELRTFPELQRDAVQRGSVYVEIGSMHLAADAGYPVTNLAALCKELIRSC